MHAEDVVAEVLSRAADVLDTAADYVDRGWTRCVLQDSAGNMCALGAVERAYRDHYARVALRRKQCAVVRRVAVNALCASMQEQYPDEARKYAASFSELVFGEQHLELALEYPTSPAARYGVSSRFVVAVNDRYASGSDEISACMRKAALNVRTKQQELA